MRITPWDWVVIVSVAGIFAAFSVARESSLAGLPAALLLGLIPGVAFCIGVRLVVTPLQREVEWLRGRVADLERRASGSGPTGSP